MVKAGDGEWRSSKRKRENTLQKRVSDDELHAFKERAQKAGFKDHREYLTALIFGEEGFERADRKSLIQALGELGKHGSNLNQIARALNIRNSKTLSKSDMQSIEDARAAVADVAAEIKEILE